MVAFLLLLTFFSDLAYPFTVVIDPGHGGRYAGCTGSCAGLKEKDLSLDIALRLGKLLNQRDINVILTRTGDYHLDADLTKDLMGRAQVTAKQSTDLFISLHFDFNPLPTVRGYKLYLPRSQPIPIQSYICAGFIHHAMDWLGQPDWKGNLGNLNALDRGISAARFNVLAFSQAKASILIELEYLSNAECERKLCGEHHKNGLAQALCDGVDSYRTYLLSNG